MKKSYLAKCFNLSKGTIDSLGEDEGANAVWLPMIPSGDVKGRDGRSWTNSEPDAIVAAFDAKLPFDVEHATEVGMSEGVSTEAVGWLLELENRNGEIWALVEWNYLGRYKITDKLYLYYSPSFYYDEHGVITSMSSAGLTNKPNFYVPALNRREEEDMKFSQAIVAALSLSAEATEEQVLTAINSIKSEKQIALNSAQQPDLTKFVPKDTYSIALNRAENAENIIKAADDAAIEALVDSAIADGKIAPANKDMFVGMCRAEGGKENFSAFVATAAAVVTDKEDKKPNFATNSKLDKEELALCRKMNLTAEDFLKSKESIAAYNEQNKDA